MKDLYDRLKKLIDKVREYLKTLTFRNVIVLIFAAFAVLGVLNLILIPKSIDNTTLTINDNQTITNPSGKVVSYYNSYDNSVTSGSGNYVTIYVDDLKNIAGAEIKSLVNRVLAKKGLKASSTTVSIKQMTDTPSQGQDLSDNVGFDPTDASTVLNNPDIKQTLNFDTEPIDNTSVADFYKQNPNGTEMYAMLKISENSYTVILKNGYTEEQFRKDILANLTDGNQVQLEFIDIFKSKETLN